MAPLTRSRKLCSMSTTSKDVHGSQTAKPYWQGKNESDCFPAPSRHVPALVAVSGDRRGVRFLEFFAAKIRKPAHPARLRAGRGGVSGVV
jgi:hypothetical protein